MVTFFPQSFKFLAGFHLPLAVCDSSCLPRLGLSAVDLAAAALLRPESVPQTHPRRHFVALAWTQAGPSDFFPSHLLPLMHKTRLSSSTQSK